MKCEMCGKNVKVPFISHKGMVCLRCILLIEKAKKIYRQRKVAA